MLILILIDINIYRMFVFNFEKGLDGQNHSLLVYHHQIKKVLWSRISHSLSTCGTLKGMEIRWKMKVPIILFTCMIWNCVTKMMATWKDYCKQWKFWKWYWNGIRAHQLCKSNIWKRKTNKINNINKVREEHIKLKKNTPIKELEQG